MIKTMFDNLNLFSAGDFATVNKQLYDNGVICPSGETTIATTALKVTNSSGNASIGNGSALINGRVITVSGETVTLATNGKYTIVLEWSAASDGSQLKAITGTPAQTETLYQLLLATVVRSGTSLTVTDGRTYVNRLSGSTTTSIQTVPVAPTAPTVGQVLMHDGEKYVPTPIINNYETKTIIGNTTNATASSTMAYIQKIGGINIIIFSGNFIAKKALVYGDELGTIQNFSLSGPLTFVINNDTAHAPVGLQIMTDGKIILRGAGVSTNYYLILTGASVAYLR